MEMFDSFGMLYLLKKIKGPFIKNNRLDISENIIKFLENRDIIGNTSRIQACVQ